MEDKYGQVYPERAVAPLRDFVESLLLSIVGSQYADTTQVHLKDLRAALNASEENSFPPDEPLFLLRGQDELAAEIVHVYAQEIRDHPNKACRDAMDADHIDAHADRMERWQPRKLPD